MQKVFFPGDVSVPALGQGTWNMGETKSRHKPEAEALRAGIDLGMTLIDTAEMYGDGATEEFLGEALRGLRDKVFLVSKVYPHNAGGKKLERACEDSLRRLKTDWLDLYLLHWMGSIPLAETVRGMEALKAAGKIRAWGVSNLDLGDLKKLEQAGGQNCATDQVLYNVARRGIEFDLLPALCAQGIPLMAYSPVEQGGLPSGGVLKAVAGRHGVTIYQVALAWVLRHPNVIAIPKAADMRHVVENRAAADIKLTAQDLAEIDAAFPPAQAENQPGDAVMKTTIALLGLAAAILSVRPMPTAAQTSQDMEACRGGDATSSDQEIKGCDAVIAANNFGGENISLAFTKRCAAYRSKGQHDLAMADCSKAIEIDPRAMQALYIRGAEYEGKGDLDRALEDYGSAIAINPSNFDALNRRAWINVRKKQYDRAVADLTQAAESNDDGTASSDTSLTRITIFGNRCWVRALAGKFDDALLDCNAALAQEISVGLLDDRGFLYFEMGQFDKAIGQYNAALRVEPQSAQSLLARGLAELKNNQRARGDADIAAAQAIQPDIAGQLAAVGLQ